MANGTEPESFGLWFDELLDIGQEKRFFAGSLLPPLLIAACLWCRIRGNPQRLLKKIPQLPIPEFPQPGLAVFRFEGSHELMDLQREVHDLSHDLSLSARSIGTRLSLIAREDRAKISATLKKTPEPAEVPEIWVNLNHLSQLSVVPLIFLCTYWWDSCIWSKHASKDFPLVQCLSGSHCFYNVNQYLLMRYPKYEKLDCGSLRSRTVHDDNRRFFFEAPDDARFYKCYSCPLTFRALIQAFGDVAALFFLFCSLVAFFCIETAQSKNAYKLQSAVISYNKMLAGSMFCGLALVGCMPWLFGSDWISEDLYFALIGIAFFLTILFRCRRELLWERLELLQLKNMIRNSDDSSSSDSLDD